MSERSTARDDEAEAAPGPDATTNPAPAPAAATKVEAAEEPGRMQKFLLEYGMTGIAVLLTISALTFVGFASAFMFGFEVEGAGETAGVLAAAGAGWLLTKPIRIPLALVLTPIVVQISRRVRGQGKRDDDTRG